MDARSLPLIRYPRTPHLEGSRLQAGDEDHDQAPYSSLRGRHLVVEEKLDGANSGVRFDADLTLRLQSRGHYLLGGARERQFEVFKTWAAHHENALFERLGDRYVMFGEWLAHKHTVFYDRLPHLFQEFDLYDLETQAFLDTPRRHAVLAGSPVQSVPVLYQGPAPQRLTDLLAWVRPSLAKSPHWAEVLRTTAVQRGQDPARVAAETEASIMAEGIYLKVEENGQVIQRLKWVRADFLQALTDSDSHWATRPPIPNQLHPQADLWADRPTVAWDDLRQEQVGRAAEV